ncbi:MAG: hypothetical protein K2Y56_12705 [Methylobacterium sp.]|uniref:PGN_0703 family putative restriction endonuclease n=1 Tax=Methylobacterium sp. TaxID=409 RepID=UPI0025F3BB52|nr:hypothetical protein [Methylobacterium sp.]MBX9932380.1 hypothetical protein [Methylobacterium sp.]
MPLSRAPLVPASLLRRHDCFITGDTRFRAAARLQQSLWRQGQGLPAGLHRPGGRHDIPAITLGSLLTLADAARGANFFSPAVHAYVRRSLVLREEGACVNVDRLLRNTLSSEPLIRNALVPLALDLDLATAVFRSLLPTFVDHVTAVRFETSPSRDRKDPHWLQCGSAHDAAVEVVTMDGEPATVFIECKYSEGSGPAATHRPRYDVVSRELALHRDPDAKALRSVALEQLWRLTMLAGLCVRNGLTPQAHLIMLYPAQNRRVALACRLYAGELLDPTGTDPGTIGFTGLTLEAFVDALAQAGASSQANYLHRRYLDLTPVLDAVLRHPDSTSEGPDGPPAPSSPSATPAPLLLLPPSSPTAIAGIVAAQPASSDPAPVRPSRPQWARPLRRTRASIPAASTAPAVSGSTGKQSRKPRPAAASSRRSAAARGGL